MMRSLVEIAAMSVPDLVAGEVTLPQLRAELPGHLIPEVRRALHNCWTPLPGMSNEERVCEKCSSKEKVSTRSSCDSKENSRNIRASTRRKVVVVRE